MVVAVALAAGVVAFLAASPDQSGRVRQGELGFARLDRAWIDGALGQAADQHRAIHRTAVRERAAGAIARRWVVATAGGEQLEGGRIGIGAESPEAAARIEAWTTWADGIDRSAWQVRASGRATPMVDDREAWVVEVAVTVDRHVARPSASPRQPIAVSVQVAPPVRDGGPWRIRDLQVDGPPAGGIRAFDDPVLARSGLVDVVAPTRQGIAALAVARRAGDRLAALRERYAAVPGTDRATIWMVPRRRSITAVLGPVARVGFDDPHAIVALATTGDLVVDLEAWDAASGAQRTAELDHALVHVAWLGSLARAPRALVEGIAQAEAIAPTDATLRLVAEGAAGPIARLLVAPPDASPDPDDLVLAHALGAWLLADVGPRRTAQLLAAIDGGAEPDRAVRRTIGATPAGVDGRVRSWARTQVDAAGEQTRDAPAATGQEQSDGTEEDATT